MHWCARRSVQPLAPTGEIHLHHRVFVLLTLWSASALASDTTLPPTPAPKAVWLSSFQNILTQRSCSANSEYLKRAGGSVTTCINDLQSSFQTCVGLLGSVIPEAIETADAGERSADRIGQCIGYAQMGGPALDIYKQ